MGWSLQNVIARVVIVHGPGEGVFSYSPSLGFGNLVASTGIAMAGTDRFGNAYLAGNTTYFQTSPGHWFAIQQGSNTNGITWYTAATEAGPWTQVNQIFANGIDGGIVVQKSFTLKGGPAAGNSSENWYAPSGDTTGTTDTTFITAYLSSFGGAPGILHLLPGSYYVKEGQVTIGPGQALSHHGDRSGCTINGVGSSAAPIVTIINSSGTYQPRQFAQLKGVTIVKNSSLNGVTGLQIGDIVRVQLDVAINQFPGTSDVYVQFINQAFQTEQIQGDIFLDGPCNNIGAHFTVSNLGPLTRNGSYDRPDLRIWLDMTVNSGATAVLFDNGAFINFPDEFAIFGNITLGTGGTLLGVTGSTSTLTNPVTVSSNSQIRSGRFPIGVELNGAGTAPQTMNFGAAANVISGTDGVWNFTGTWLASNNVANVQHDGLILGDSTLVRTTYTGIFAAGAIATSGTISSRRGGTVSVTPVGAVTGIIMQAGLQQGQRLTVVNESANLVTFAVAATSNVAAGASATVPANGNREFVWDTGTSLWYGGV